jgi:hypothetical protein
MKKGNTRVYFLGFVLFVALFALGFITFFSVEQENIRTEGYLNSLGDFFSLGWIFSDVQPLVDVEKISLETSVSDVSSGLKKIIVSAKSSEDPIIAIGSLRLKGEVHQIWPFGAIKTPKKENIQTDRGYDTHLLIDEGNILIEIGSLEETNDGSNPLDLELSDSNSEIGLGSFGYAGGDAIALKSKSNSLDIVQVVVPEEDDVFISVEVCTRTECSVFTRLKLESTNQVGIEPGRKQPTKLNDDFGGIGGGSGGNTQPVSTPKDDGATGIDTLSEGDVLVTVGDQERYRVEGNKIIGRDYTAESSVAIYEQDDQIYAQLLEKNVPIAIGPDAVARAVTELTNADVKKLSIRALDDIAIYTVIAEKKGKLLGVFGITIGYEIIVNAEDGKVIELNIPWWEIFVTGL